LAALSSQCKLLCMVVMVSVDMITINIFKGNNCAFRLNNTSKTFPCRG
jgi:hypothetical protein